MYAIPAETASQGQPFQKENLPGPGKFILSCASLSRVSHCIIASGPPGVADMSHKSGGVC